MRSRVLLSLFKKVPESRVNSKKFKEVFQIDDVPVWYFMEFLIDTYLPKPFRAPWEIENDMREGRSESFFDKLKYKFSSFILRKGILLNEKLRQIVCESKSDIEYQKADALFVQLTSQVTERDGELVFFGSGKIIKSLKKSRKIKPLVVFGDPFSKISQRPTKYRPLVCEYATKEIFEKSERWAKELSNKWRSLDEKVKINMFGGEVSWKFLRNDMDILFSKEILFILIKYYLLMKEVMKKHDIKLICLTSMGGFYDVASLSAAYKLGKKVLYIPHGYTGIQAGRRELIKNIFVAVSGPAEKEFFLRGGFKKVFVTGSPFFDEIVKYREKVKKKTNKKTVCFITTQLVESKFMKKAKYFKLIRLVLEQIGKVKEIEKIIIKLHPAEKYKNEYESIVRSLNLNKDKEVQIRQGATKAELYSTMASSDLLIGFGSTALLEGAMLGKDVLHLDMFLENPQFFKFREGTLCVRRIESLAHWIKKIFHDNNVKNKLKRKRERYLHKSFYKIDGNAHRRVANLIVRLIEKS